MKELAMRMWLMVAVGLLGAVMLWGCGDRQRGNWELTRRALDQMRAVTLHYQITHECKVHWSKTSELLAAIKAEPALFDLPNKQTATVLARDEDGWGHPFLFVRDREGVLVEIRSNGENGRDDGGGADDLAVRVTGP